MIKAIEPLGKHDRAAFSCGVAALDNWFRLRAGQDEKRNVARVFVAIHDQHGIVGFYSLSSFTLAIADLPPEHVKRLPRYGVIPAALIGRLARDLRVRGEGVGGLLLADAVRRVIGALVRWRFLLSWSTRRMKWQQPFIAILDSRRFRTTHSDYLCLRRKRRRLFPARCFDRGAVMLARVASTRTAAARVSGAGQA